MTGDSRVSICLVGNFEKEKRQCMLCWLQSCGVPGDVRFKGASLSDSFTSRHCFISVHVCMCVYLNICVCVHAGAYV